MRHYLRRHPVVLRTIFYTIGKLFTYTLLNEIRNEALRSIQEENYYMLKIEKLFLSPLFIFSVITIWYSWH